MGAILNLPIINFNYRLDLLKPRGTGLGAAGGGGGGFPNIEEFPLNGGVVNFGAGTGTAVGNGLGN